MPDEENKYAEPIKVDLEAYIASLPQPAGPEVVGLGVTDPIYLSQMIYKNEKARRSLSVHHLQRRLKELGLKIEDRDGWFGDSTKKAIFDFQRANGLTETGKPEAEHMALLFQNDPNVTLLP